MGWVRLAAGLAEAAGEPGMDSVVVALAQGNTAVVEPRIDVAVATGKVLVEGGLGTDTARAEGLGKGSVASRDIDFVEDKLAFDWLCCNKAESHMSYIQAVVAVAV